MWPGAWLCRHRLPSSLWSRSLAAASTSSYQSILCNNRQTNVNYKTVFLVPHRYLLVSAYVSVQIFCWVQPHVTMPSLRQPCTVQYYTFFAFVLLHQWLSSLKYFSNLCWLKPIFPRNRSTVTCKIFKLTCNLTEYAVVYTNSTYNYVITFTCY